MLTRLQIYVYTYFHLYTYVYILTYIHMNNSTLKGGDPRQTSNTAAHVCVYTSLHVYTCIYIHILMHLHIYTYLHIHTYTPALLKAVTQDRH